MFLNACILKIIVVHIYCCGFGVVVNFLLTALFKLVNGLTPESSWSWLPSSSVISSSFSSSVMSTKDVSRYTASSIFKLTRNVFFCDTWFIVRDEENKVCQYNKQNKWWLELDDLDFQCSKLGQYLCISFDPESLSQNFQTTRGRFCKNSEDLKTETRKLVSTRMKL